MKTQYSRLSEILERKYGVVISVYHKLFIEKVIGERIEKIAGRQLDLYLNILDSEMGREESEAIKNALNNSYTDFFRDPLVFSLLEKKALPSLVREKLKGPIPEFRIWSAGCASGNEPYSLAMMLNETIRPVSEQMRFKIYATDYSEKKIQFAQSGIYKKEEIQNIKYRYVEKYFNHTKDGFQIKETIKNMVDFSCHDLLDSKTASPISGIFNDFDLIICSNVLMYYKAEIQKSILNNFMNSLNHNCLLVVGESEMSVMKSYKGFRQLYQGAPVYYKL